MIERLATGVTRERDDVAITRRDLLDQHRIAEPLEREPSLVVRSQRALGAEAGAQAGDHVLAARARATERAVEQLEMGGAQIEALRLGQLVVEHHAS